MNALNSRVSDMFGVPYPIFAFAHHEDVVVEVCKAGGIGIYGGTRKTPDEIRAVLRDIRDRVGDLPFGIDLVIPKGMPATNNREEIEAQLPVEHRAFVEHLQKKYNVPTGTGPGMRSRFVRSEETAAAQLEAVLESDANILALGIGTPVAAVEAAKADGKTVISLVGSPRHAVHAIDGGADIIVAQGYDAGAHTGQIGTFSLVPQIVDVAGGRPVLAAGGVATGRHIAAAYALGAEGVWIGTPWLITRENHTDPVVLKKLLSARSDDTVISRADSGKTLRQVRTAWSEEWANPEAPVPLKMPFQDILVGDILGAIDQGRVEALMHSPAGQGIAYYSEETTTAEVMRLLVEEAEATLSRIGS
ncbi:MAG: NAD(P)H-dependent flavin oxidoreductase [Dehalococcoidia bacterium]